MVESGGWYAVECGRFPAIGHGIVTAALVSFALMLRSAPSAAAPDNHLCSRPHSCVLSLAVRSGGAVRAVPGVGCGVVARSGVKSTAAAPDNHLCAGPDRGHGIIAIRQGMSRRPGLSGGGRVVDFRHHVGELRL